MKLTILVTGFNGKVGIEVAKKLKDRNVSMKCAVRNVEKAKNIYGEDYAFTTLDLSDTGTFDEALDQVDQVFLIYPPGDKLEFQAFLEAMKKRGIQHIVYLSVKDVQYLPFIHHYKNEKMIKKLGIPYTFIRAGYFMQNLQDFLADEIKENRRIFIPAGKGKTSFVDTRDLAEIAIHAFQHPLEHTNKNHVITGDRAVDFYEVAEMMSAILGEKIQYSNPTVKEFKSYMVKKGEKEDFVNVVIGIHFPTKLGLAKGVTHEFKKITNTDSIRLERYIEDYQGNWQ
ncbi:SDR family oxidoreductase [Rossellomorea sp. NRS-1567]|uniref:SDR family oxidoreductase n=1 Tax=Rossellomorea sp. NRS-1567 TaxID=3233901 RepID=UPI003D292796